MRMLQAAFVFVCFMFVYSIVWYTFTPVVDMILNGFSSISTAGWPEQAVTTFQTLTTIFTHTWTWIGVLSMLSTLIWYAVFPFREEVQTRVRYY